jgi:glutaminyl-peptide cyclotransferase
MFLWPFLLRKSMLIRSIFIVVAIAVLSSCGKREKPREEKPSRIVKVPEFSADSAYRFADEQVKFGPRIPNRPAHIKAGDYFVRRLKEFGAIVIEQNFEANTFDGQRLSLRNIIASYAPERQKRVLLAAHWDTRPYSDKDASKPDATFDGANDGASGVAVLMEIARVIGKSNPPEVGVDIILFDGEDWGEKDGATTSITPPKGLDSWWCLGSQYWSKHKHKKGYSAYYGILLDMVGAKNAHFFKEGYSMEYAPRIVEKVWGTASRLGKSSLFVNQKEAPITDDHRFVNEIGKIPMIDIVHFDPVKGYFGDFHHTQKDNMSLISKESLGATGTVLLNVIYYEE